MRIGIDLYAFNHSYSGGVSTFSLGLVEGILKSITDENELILLTSIENEKIISNLFSHLKVKIVSIHLSRSDRYLNYLIFVLSWIVSEYRLRLWFDKIFRLAIKRTIESTVDALIIPTTVMNFYNLEIPTILCIHDIQQEFHPEFFTLIDRINRWAPYRLSCYLATNIQVSSNYIKTCLIEKFKFLYGNEKFLVAPEGVDIHRFSESAPCNLPSNLSNEELNQFTLYPAQIWKHKNHKLLMYALASYREKTGSELPCVLTGQDFGYWPEVSRLKEVLKLNKVYYLGKVDFGELIWLYKNCTSVLALGLHESSSLPLREGAIFGKILICADIPQNIETAVSLNLNLFDKNNSNSLTYILLSTHAGDENHLKLAQENINKALLLQWDFVAKLYVERLKFLHENYQKKLNNNSTEINTYPLE